MDARLLNAAVVVGTALVGVGVGLTFTWPIAAIVVGSGLVAGAFRAAARGGM